MSDPEKPRYVRVTMDIPTVFVASERDVPDDDEPEGMGIADNMNLRHDYKPGGNA